MTMFGRRLPCPAWVDVLLAAVFAAAVVAGTVAVAAWTAAGGKDDASRPLDALGVVLLVVAAAVPVGLRRVTPLGALIATVLVVNAYLLVGYPYGPVLLCLVIAVFEVARQRSLRVSAVICGSAAAVASATILVRALGDQHATWLLALVWTGWIVLPWSLGALVHVLDTSRQRARRELIARTALEERMRIAGEVHDIAGHGFALITMQAAVALVVIEEQPDQVRRCLEAVRQTRAGALADLRQILDTFHPHPQRPAGLADLVQQVRSGGQPVEVTVDHLGDLPEPLGATVYRVVQEALTNVLRHAGPTTAEVAVDRSGGHVLVRVTDRGRATPATVGPPGRGLAGMRRRVEDLHGRLEAGPRDGGGFQVVARLPVPVPVSAPGTGVAR